MAVYVRMFEVDMVCLFSTTEFMMTSVTHSYPSTYVLLLLRAKTNSLSSHMNSLLEDNINSTALMSSTGRIATTNSFLVLFPNKKIYIYI